MIKLIFLIAALLIGCWSPLSAQTLSTAEHTQREADTLRGFNLGRQIGAKRAQEGFPKPTLDYLDSILRLTAPNESEGFKVGFKAGYLDGWEKRDGTSLK